MSVMSTTKVADQAARQLAGQGLLLGLGIPGICLITFAIFGLLLHPSMGYEAWVPFLEFASGLPSAVTGTVALLALFLLLLVVASFGHWRRLLATSNESHDIVEGLLTVARRRLRLAFSPFIPASHVSPDQACRALPLHPPERTLASTPAGLSGASPLLE